VASVNIAEAQAIAEQLMAEHGLLPRWKFHWNDNYREIGCCRWLSTRRYRGPSISLSRPVIEVNDRAFLVETILHEIAHALAGPRHKHDAIWREIARRIGCTGDRCSRPMVHPTRALTEGRMLRQYARWEARLESRLRKAVT
jgi:predicted SprT family Zn-dependent metalloprotease